MMRIKTLVAANFSNFLVQGASTYQYVFVLLRWDTHEIWLEALLEYEDLGKRGNFAEHRSWLKLLVILR